MKRDMFRHRIATIAVGAALLITGATLTWAAEAQTQKQTQTRVQDQNRMQAIESIKLRLSENPRDQGLRYAEQCLERSEQCQDMHSLDQAMESVGKNMERHPDDEGLRHAMEHLEMYHQRLEKKHIERERSMHGNDPSWSEKPERHV